MSPMPFASILALIVLASVLLGTALGACVVAGLLLPWWGSLPLIVAVTVGVAWTARRYVFGIR